MRQLRARVHIHRRARQHAQLAHPVIGPGAHLGQTHQQVDDKKRHQRHQAQGEQVERTFIFYAPVELGQTRVEARLQTVAQKKARRQKSQRGPDAGRKRHNQRAPAQSKNGATCQGQHHRTGNRERGGQHIHHKVAGDEAQGLVGIPLGQGRLAAFKGIKA